MDGFKLTTKQCQDVIRDNPEQVYDEHLGKLYAKLALSNQEREIYRLQGAIAILSEVIGLKDKSLHQIER